MTEAKLIKAPVAPGLSVIEASAGTGKTWTIAHLVSLWLVRGTVERVDQMVLVTFTEAAAAELGERVRKTLAALVALVDSGEAAPDHEPGLKELLQELGQLSATVPVSAATMSPRQVAVNRLQGALEEADRLLVCTIHSFCRRVLSDESFLCSIPPGFEIKADAGPLIERGLRDAWRAGVEGDALVAAVAAVHRWKFSEDLKFVRTALQKADLSVEPNLNFENLRRHMAQSLAGLRDRRLELKNAVERSEALLSEGAGLNKAGRAKAAAGFWLACLEGLDPENPDPLVFEFLDELGKVPKWLSRSKGDAALRAKVGEALRDFETLPLLGHAKDLGESPDHLHWAWLNHARKACASALEMELKRDNALTYDSLVLRLREALVSGEVGLRADLLKRLRKRWKLALVDESQDTDPAQLEIFRAIFANAGDEGGHQLILVGDPKQAIYGFRGADLRAYLDARDQATERMSLVDTYRSAPGLVEAQNALWKRAAPALGHPELAVLPARAARKNEEFPLPGLSGHGPRMVACIVPESQRDAWGSADRRRRLAAAATASAIVDVLGQPMGMERVLPGHCAVLTASHGEARLVQAELSRRGVPAVLVKAGNVFLSEECEDLRVLLGALLLPGHRGMRRAALATRLLGFSALDLVALGDEREERWQRLFVDWKDIWAKRGLAALVQAMDQAPEAACFSKLARLPGGERRITDLKHVLDLAHKEEAQNRKGPKPLMEWLESTMAAADDKNAPEEHLRRLETDDSAVQIMTMHGAKGLEFDLVFCPSLWESAWEGQGRRTHYDLGRDGERGWVLFDRDKIDEARAAALLARQKLEEMREDLRLAYVALTRAKRRVWFLAGWIGYQGDKAATVPSALDWLLRDTSQADAADPAAWMSRMLVQKKWAEALKAKLAPVSAPQCEHEQSLQALKNELPDLVALVGLTTHDRPYVSRPRVQDFAQPALRHNFEFRAWRRISYTSLVRAVGDDDSEGAVPIPPPGDVDAAFDASAVALVSLPGGKNTGICLHELLERWDFRGDPSVLIQKTLSRYGLNLGARMGPKGEQFPAIASLLAQILPRLADARVPVLKVTLSECAGESALSELRFLLPVGARGISGADLAAVFGRHGDERLKAYAPSLAGIPKEAVGGMLEGSIDRLVQVDRRWVVLDWKSNRLGDSVGDYGADRLWSLAVEEHYILQMVLYMVVARRYLARRAPGDRLIGGGLAFLRGMDAGLERGLLMLEVSDGLLDGVDDLFARREQS